MIKVIALLPARTGLSQQEFIDHWKHVHGPLARRAPGAKYMRRYVHNYPIEGISPDNGFAGVVECWFESLDEMNACVDNDFYREVIAPDEERFIDWSRAVRFIVEENVVIDAGNDAVCGQ